MLNQSMDMGTDIASFFLFHPDDLAHRNDDPLDWHDYGFACRKEFEAGNLVAFRTGSDGGYQLRLTDGDLTDAERALQTGSWKWGYTVRHGKVLVDNGDYLPSDEALNIKKVPEKQWVTMPNGDYRVTVHPIAREDDSLPDYVIRFEVRNKPLSIADSPSPPNLVPLKDKPPQAVAGGSADEIYGDKAEEKPLLESYPLLMAEGQHVLPGGSVSVAVADDLFNAVSEEDSPLSNAEGDVYVVLAPSENVPELATLAWVNGWSQMTGESGNLKLRGERLVRVTDRAAGKPLPTARVEPVPRMESPLSEGKLKALQAAFLKHADQQSKGKNKITTFERDRIAAMTTGAALTTRLIGLVPMPVETRFRLQAASDTERAKELMTILESA